MTVKGYISKTSSLKAPVVDLETLIVLKTMTVGRDKDTMDLLSLFRDRRDDIDKSLVAERAKAADLVEHLLDRIRDYARRLREDELDEVWFNVTATRLPHTEKREIGSLFSKLAELFRRS